MPNNHFTHKRDSHYKKAKKEGYRARSAFKLIEIQKKYNIFKRVFYILDLGCAPGSWLQVAKLFAEQNLKKYNDQYYHRDHYIILGVDIKNVSPLDNVKIINADITEPDLTVKIELYFQNKLDLIVSDISISKTGNKFTDHLKQINLCYTVLELAKKLLKNKGTLVLKTFQGTDFNKFIDNMKKDYLFVKSYKPQSSKKKSNEIYIIGLQKI